MFTEEKFEALNFLDKYKYEPVVEETLYEAKKKIYTHSDRWSIIYDMIDEAYPEYKGTKVVTGLVYLVEEGKC